MAQQRLGILGGTFDPIHIAHLFIAEEARLRVELDRVVFIPNRVPPHKTGDRITPAEDRYRMTELAIAPNPAFHCSRIELDREGPSFTVDTLTALRAEYPRAALYLIAGLDAVSDILTWRLPGEVLRLARLIAIARQGFDSASALGSLPPEMRRRIRVLRVPLLEISSTAIRRRVRCGSSVRYLVPDDVADYIASRGLYRD